MTVPGSLEGILDDGDRYVQYRVLLNTDDPALTPVLEDISIFWDPLGVNPEPPVAGFFTLGAAPNPSEGTVFLHFVLPAAGEISVRVYDASGRIRHGSEGEVFQAGEGSIRLDGLPSGLYLYRIDWEGCTGNGRFLVLD
jgi:hypothetical protein